MVKGIGGGVEMIKLFVYLEMVYNEFELGICLEVNCG